MRKILLTIILLLPFTALSHADEKNHTELIEQLFKVMNLENGYESTIDEMLNIQIKNQPMLKPVTEVMKKFFHKYIGWNEIKPELIKLYKQEFNEDELRDLVGFFSSPVGILWLEKSQDLSLKIMEISQNIVNQHQEELSKMIIEEIDKKSKAFRPSPDAPQEDQPVNE